MRALATLDRQVNCKSGMDECTPTSGSCCTRLRCHLRGKINLCRRQHHLRSTHDSHALDPNYFFAASISPRHLARHLCSPNYLGHAVERSTCTVIALPASFSSLTTLMGAERSAIRRISSRNSFGIGGRPALDFHRHKSRKPALCQRISIWGSEMTNNHAMLIPPMAAALITNGTSRAICREVIYHALARRILQETPS